MASDSVPPGGHPPQLPPPGAAAQARAKQLFGQLLGDIRTLAAAPSTSSRLFAGVRCYDVALSLLPDMAPAGVVPQASPPSKGPRPPPTVLPYAAFKTHVRPAQSLLPEGDEPAADGRASAAARPRGGPAPLLGQKPPAGVDTQLEPTMAAAAHFGPQPLPARPPSGVPAVRRAVARPPEAAPQPISGNTPPLRPQDTATLHTAADGTMALSMVLHDPELGELACDIAVSEGRATATFTVTDVNTRRLLEAEAAKLRLGLEKQGLRDAAIRVVLVHA